MKGLIELSQAAKGDRERPTNNEQLNAAHTKAEEALLAVLTDEQRQRLDRIKREPFDLKSAGLAPRKSALDLARSVGQAGKSAVAHPNNARSGRGATPIPGGEKLQLLMNAAVQKDLELANDQKADVKTIADSARGRTDELARRLQGYLQLSPQERSKRSAEVRAKHDTIALDVRKNVHDVLLSHQKQRLIGLFVQLRGIDSLIDAEVAEEVGLSPRQREELSKVRVEAGRKVLQTAQASQAGQTALPQWKTLRSEVEEKLLAVLTSEQRAKFDELKGEPFDFKAAGIPTSTPVPVLPSGTPMAELPRPPKLRPR